MLQIRQSKFSDIYSLAKNLREEDKEELEALGETPLNSLKAGIRTGEKCFTVLVDGKIAGMYGYSKKDINNSSIIWFLGSRDCDKVPVAFVKEGRKLVNELTKDRDLRNIVYSGNKSHITYLKYLGFTVAENYPVEINNHYFYYFYKKKR